MSVPAAAVGRARILVVDDEMGPRESLRMLLKGTYEVRTADSGPAGLDEMPSYRPDLVILDIKMPEMNGLEVLRHVKERDPSVEVVMITAYASLETVRQALTYGAFEYLIKPFSRTDLENTVRRALQRRQQEIGARSAVSRLVDEMIRDVSRERGALPLLAFAASRLWEKRDRERGLLTREAYKEIGGVG